MKLNVNRETTIGLSVLLVLLVVLGVVAVRRFLRPIFLMRRSLPRRRRSCRRTFADRAKHETESCPKPALLTPVETPDRDQLAAAGRSGPLEHRFEGAKKRNARRLAGG